MSRVSQGEDAPPRGRGLGGYDTTRNPTKEEVPLALEVPRLGEKVQHAQSAAKVPREGAHARVGDVQRTRVTRCRGFDKGEREARRKARGMPPSG